MRLTEGTFIFNAAIAIDRFFNFCTGGSFQECFSTRAYIQSIKSKPLYNRKRWLNIRSVIDWLFWEGHCEDSFHWEMRIKAEYIKKHQHL